LKVQTLASGSSGNCTFIDSGATKILVDAGISTIRLSKNLKSIGVRMNEIDGVVISHEHSDHTRAIKDLPVPVYVSSKTAHLWRRDVEILREFRAEEPFSVGDAVITPFPVPHDALDPVGFTFKSADRKVGIATDIGSVTGVVLQRLKGCDMLIIESNHDEGRLISGNYSWDLKQRVGGPLGHLSNRQCCQLLESVAHSKLRFVLLAHLSESNNLPGLALEAARSVLRSFSASLHVASRDSGEVFVL